jgi:4-hydroxy-3-methylbut-2-en-1-yl diphosphate synthase IspG/GcpE
MNLYYTNVAYADQAQNRPDLSLGGFRSSSKVPSADYNNLFGDVSAYSIQTNKEEYICIMLKNETGVIATAVKLWVSLPTETSFKIEVGATTPTITGEVERIQTPYQRPMYATFVSVEGEVNAASLGNIAINGMIALWFKKIVNISALQEQETDTSLANYFAANSENRKPSVQDIDIVLSWT